MHTILISDFLSLKKVDFLSLKKVIEDSTRRTSTKRYLVISTWVCVCVGGGGAAAGGVALEEGVIKSAVVLTEDPAKPTPST